MQQIVIHRYDPISAIHWLEFPDKPDEDTRKILKGNRWRFSGYRVQWYKSGMLTPMPDLSTSGYTLEDAGECDYSEERAERLEARAVKAGREATVAHQQAHSIMDMIPPGQPILV